MSDEFSHYEIDVSETIHTPHGYAFRVSPQGEVGVGVEYREGTSEWISHMDAIGGADLAMVLASMVRVALTTDDADIVRTAVVAALGSQPASEKPTGDGTVHLWRLSQSVVDGDDTYDSCVVAARSMDDARRTHPSGYRWSTNEYRDALGEAVRIDDWCAPENVAVDLIGEASSVAPGTVVCASFNAG